MPQVRYRVDDVPPQWADAFMPMPTLSPAGATSVSWSIHAAWGTEQVPVSPNHKASGTLSKSPEWKDPSAVAPDYFCPDVVVQDIRLLGPPVHYLPLPAAMLVPPVEPLGTMGPQGPPAVVMRGRKIGGRRSMHWPRVVPRWPGLNGQPS
jgi:hypothetical protein